MLFHQKNKELLTLLLFIGLSIASFAQSAHKDASGINKMNTAPIKNSKDEKRHYALTFSAQSSSLTPCSFERT